MSVCVALQQTLFKSGAFWDKCTDWPQCDLEHYMVISKLHKCYLSPKFVSDSLYDQPLSVWRPFCGNCTEWPPNDLEYYNVKRSPICVLLVSLDPTATAVFELQAICTATNTTKWPATTTLGQGRPAAVPLGRDPDWHGSRLQGGRTGVAGRGTVCPHWYLDDRYIVCSNCTSGLPSPSGPSHPLYRACHL